MPVTLKGTYHLRAPRESIYAIVTDFEHAPALFPRVAQSMTVLQRNGNHLILRAQTKTFGMVASVEMHTELLPPRGFHSINTSKLGVEDEWFLMDQDHDGTCIHYTNVVTVTHPLLRNPLGTFLLTRLALPFWERMYIRPLRAMLETH